VQLKIYLNLFSFLVVRMSEANVSKANATAHENGTCWREESCSFDIFPSSTDTPFTLAFKVTKMLLIIVAIMIYFSYETRSIVYVLATGIVFVLILSLISFFWTQNKKENYFHIPIQMEQQPVPVQLQHPVPVQLQHPVPVQLQSTQQPVPVQLQHPVPVQLQQPVPVQLQQPVPVQLQSQVQPSTYYQPTVPMYSVQQAQQLQPQPSFQEPVSYPMSGSAYVHSAPVPIPIHSTQVSSIPSRSTPSHSTPVYAYQATTHLPYQKQKVTMISDSDSGRVGSDSVGSGREGNIRSFSDRSTEYFTPYMGQNKKIYKEPVLVAPRIMDPEFSVVHTSFPVHTNPLQEMGGMGNAMEEPREFKGSMAPRISLRNKLLMESTDDDGNDDVNYGGRNGGKVRRTRVVSENELKPLRTYLQDIQPNLYSISNEKTAINANLGISSTPQMPERRKMMIRTNQGHMYPLYSRIDPQLIRDDVPEERRVELPKRGEWSDHLPVEAPSNQPYDIYDPRSNGYGDANRSYYDVDLGQIKYYYSDIDAYRRPNFIIRNKVDHVDFIDPMGQVRPEYNRTATLNDVKEQVNDDWLAKSTEFREDIMEKLMRKNNSQSWQLRKAPHSKGAHLATFTSGY